MITCLRKHLEARCSERGYAWEDVRGCIVAEDGQRITVDETHPAYPRPRRGLPGTELKALLKTIGIVSSPTCSCNKRAAVMDAKGCDWCEENIDQIDAWLAEEAKKRKLPYLSVAGKALIRLAIRRARKKGNG